MGVARQNPPGAPALPDFEHSLPMALLRARESAMARFRPMLRSHGLTEQQWRVVRALADLDDLDAGELAERSFLLAPSLTRILKTLEADGLVRRSIDPTDQRRALVSLSAKGRRTFDRIAPDSERVYREIEKRFGRANLNRLYALLGAFEDALLD